MFDFKDSRYTHMPFVAYDDKGHATEFCCIRNDAGVWKLHYFNGKNWKRIKTELPEDTTECSPTAEFDDGIWKISFIAGGSEKDRRFRLYRMYGIGGLVSIQTFADVGFVWKDRVCYAGRRGPIVIFDREQKTTLQLHNVEYLYRVSYNPDCPNELLISGQYMDGTVFSWAYHPYSKVLQSLTVGGEPAYKCAFFKGACFYGERKAGFEERRIVKAENLERHDLIAGLYITEKTEAASGRSGNPVFE